MPMQSPTEASTGGTAKAIRDAGLAVKDVAEVTGFPEMMDGRVKTLHPMVHGGLLGRSGLDDAVMAEHGIGAIDLLVLNLYPFEAVTARADCTLADAVENIDIGGPAMLRSAATECCVGLVLSSPDAARYGTSETCRKKTLSRPTSWRTWKLTMS